jgi:hypothetical protein
MLVFAGFPYNFPRASSTGKVLEKNMFYQGIHSLCIQVASFLVHMHEAKDSLGHHSAYIM